MKKLFLIMLCVSCVNEFPEYDYEADYDDARRSTVDAWEEIIGPVSEDCYDLAKSAIIGLTFTFPASCTKVYKQISGCHQTVLNRDGTTVEYILILDGRSEYDKVDTAVHEYIHILAGCETGDGDGLHKNEKYWDDYGEDTVEAYGCAGLTYEN